MVAYLVIAIGIGIRSWAAGMLRKGCDLTTTGPYSLCRHPLYVGSFVMMLGFCIGIGCPYNFLALSGPFLVLYCLTMLSEEARLASVYGARWDLYRRQTPRFIPAALSLYTPGPWSFWQWKQNREYNALFGGMCGVLVLEVLS